ncbi:MULTISPECIES: ABC transporter ATP-binding protein [unclassified Aeromicrobium]|jgi:ABC-type branched-subunit amino acid transport system ATPase component|uniref:ABC transporter ATP-binding protein n=1 Tax=unclassified Aeromicrobium TaxID=2633570 RepID=UPI00288A44EE|nr:MULTISPECIES: ABC transporter ATP-binding protein [unclassified Aeromicrobium]
MSDALLTIEGLTKRFGGVTAVNGVDMVVPQGTVMGLMGPNGAGKTSLVNLVTGFYTPDEGSVLFEGDEMAGLAPHQISRRGITRTYQNVRLLSGFSVLEQVVAGMYASRKASSLSSLVMWPGERRERRECLERADALLARVGVTERRELAETLPYGTQRRVEIARALATDPRLVLLDEPTAGMNREESVAVGELIRSVRDQGLTVLVVEHNMRLILDYCDAAYVMSFGEVLSHGTPQECVDDPAVQKAYFGKENDASGIPALRELRSDPRRP